MRTHARVCIVGGGAMGVGLLYHLALEGWTEIMLVEKGELTSGSTWHAAGQCPHFIPSLSMAKIHHYATELYPRLEALTGQAVGWHDCGGIRLALTREEVNWFHYVKGISRLVGFDMEILSPQEIREYHPFLNLLNVKAGALTFNDGHVDPASLTHAMARGARDLGASIEVRNRALNIHRQPNGEWEVITEKGRIVCEHVVNAAGSYCAMVGRWNDLEIPITNLLHHYVVSESVAEIAALETELPVVRDPYCSGYLRQEQNALLVGIYETTGAKKCLEDIRWDFESELLPPELERLEPWLAKACERLPLFGKYGIRRIVSGAITHTPDGNFLAGPAPGSPNYWLCCGASIGIAQSAGAGKYLAQWMVHGQTEIAMDVVDPRRFGHWANEKYCQTMSLCDYEHMYDLLAPGEQHDVARPQRISPLFDTLSQKGAKWEAISGWEQARWFSTKGEEEQYSFHRTNEFASVAKECRTVREKVGIADLSALAKFDLYGTQAGAFLNRITANGAPQRVGGMLLTHLLSQDGKIEAEMTVTRLSDTHFYLVASSAAEVKNFDLLTKGLASFDKVQIANLTETWGALLLSGPRSRDVLAALTEETLTKETFAWLTGKEIKVARAPVRALRVSYVGELGWELHMPMAHLERVYHALWQVGDSHGMTDFGSYAMNSLRLEKAYRAMGTELSNEVTLNEAGMRRFINTHHDFIGRSATLNAAKRSEQRQLGYLGIETDDTDARGNEPIFAGDRLVGVSTSGGFGHVVNQSLAFAYLDPVYANSGQILTIELLGQRRRCRVIPSALWDPRNERLHA